jgi:hypothetical protein
MMSSRARYCSLWGTDRDRCRVPQSRVGHSRTISYFKRAVRRRATPSGSETQSRFALPTQPTQLGHCPTAPYLSVSFLQPLGCAAVISWQRHLAGQNGIKLRAHAPRRGRADGQRAGHEIRYDGHRMHARIDGGQVKSLTRPPSTALASILAPTSARSRSEPGGPLW